MLLLLQWRHKINTKGHMKMVFKKNNLPQSIYLDQVQISDGFWGKRQSVNRENTIPAIYKKLQETGRIDAWNMNPDRQLAEKRSVIHMFYDSDTFNLNLNVVDLLIPFSLFAT